MNPSSNTKIAWLSPGALRLWTIDLITAELNGMRDPAVAGKNIWSPHRDTLPRLPPWGSPNGWDYRGRPWAYMDTPNGHGTIPVNSPYVPPTAQSEDGSRG